MSYYYVSVIVKLVWVIALKRALKLLETKNFFLLTNVGYVLRELENSYSLCLTVKKKLLVHWVLSFDLSNVKIMSINIAELSDLFMSKSTFNYCIHFWKSVLHSWNHIPCSFKMDMFLFFFLWFDHQHSKQAERTSNDIIDNFFQAKILLLISSLFQKKN